MILISACLCGVNCKYNGSNNYNEKIKEILEEYEYMLVCPEQLGGLTTPRKPAEIIKDKVIDNEGKDVTINFEKGALETLKIAQLTNTKYALLKEGSPSCGSNFIYDGNFNGTKILGEGLTAKLLKKNGIKIFSENEIEDLKDKIK
ncbi:hypothetical protein HMPREF1092_01169 [Clostridium thermobutyricum]|uniref:Uncharacterized protein n=1 Tax=Clostridium thermobutyricum TaxID=29372 RepID=N9WGC3_9CLOT|nr:DUF523 domain-containing protein [Clostridium thermobutyricum]ENZ01935.1 hypothetical protein HMPREF1092_01169 [Clostridium thermobutyricum]